MTSSPAGNGLSLAAVAATLVAALSLDPVVDGHGWLLTAGLAVLAVFAAGAAVRQATAWWPAVTGAQLVVLLVTLTVLFAREDALFGILPGRETLRTLRAVWATGEQVVQSQAPPVDPRAGVVLMLTVGIGLVAVAVDLVAVSLRHPALGGLPLLAVYCVPAAVLPDGVPWYLFLLGGAGFLLLISADADDRVRSWGRVLSSRGDGRAERAAGEIGGLTRDGRRVAAVTLVVAAVLPAFVPGLGERLFGNGSDGTGGDGKGQSISVINPILDLRQNLTSPRNEVVLRYRTSQSQPEPLRIVTADVFNGRTWAPDNRPIPLEQRVSDGLPPPPGLTTEVTATPETTEVDVVALAQTYLPMPYPATEVDVEGPWLYDRRTLNVVGRGVTTRGLSYTVQHLAVRPTAEQLDAATAAPAAVSDTYTRLPRNLPTSIRDTARQVGGSGVDHYAQAVRIQRWFRSGGGFVYSTELPGNGRGDGGQDAVESFLRDRRGYCVQFASAMAVMARTLGIPARVAVGFLPGQSESEGVRVVRLHDAHAWPELYFDGVGWVRFEPTPAGQAGVAPTWSVPDPTVLAEDTPTPTSSSSGGPVPSARATRPDQQDATTGGADTSAVQSVLGAVPWRLVVVAGVAALLALLPKAASGLSRRRRWRRARSPAARAETAWEDLGLRLADLGVRWATWWTPRAVLARLGTEYRLGEDERAALGRLVADLEGARYARPGDGAGRSTQSREADVRAVTHGVAAAVEPRARRRARWFPASGLAVVTGTLRRVDAVSDDAGRRVAELGSAVRRRTVGSGRR